MTIPLPARLFAIVLALTVAAGWRTGVAMAQRGGAPEAATGTDGKGLTTAGRHMVAAANPLAVEAGLAMLREGGGAIDAAIAAQLVLNLVEPQSSGLGGGAFLLHWDAATKALVTYDGRETAPAAARPDRFLVNSRPRSFEAAVASGLAVGVPGVLRALETAHERHGRLPWARLFEPAIKLADDGFPVSRRLHLLLHGQGARSFPAEARAYFYDTRDDPRRIGERLANPAFAVTLRRIAAGGAQAFYTGAIADALVAAVGKSANAPGDMTTTDLALYRAVERPALCTAYRGYRVCGMGPPSSGGLAIAQVLGLVEPLDLGRGPAAAMNGAALHTLAEALKLAFADRNHYVADPAFVAVPAGLLDPGYLADRRRLIDPLATMAKAYPGRPPEPRQANGADTTRESDGTSHISIVDGSGNALAMTTTIETGFGSRLWAAGFLLNNELTDFAFRPRDASGRALANRVEPGKRPRSSMAPTIVFAPDGRLFAVLGSPGGSRIIPYVLKTIVALIDWQLDARAAVGLPNFASSGGPLELELDGRSLWHALKAKPFGHVVNADHMTSGLHVIVRRGDGRLEGGADPRREGVARGD